MMIRSLFILTLSTIILTSCVEETNPENAREDFLGNWTCNEYEGEFAPQTYNVIVQPSGSGNDVRVIGLYNQGSSFSLTAYVSGSTLFIENQTVNGITITGFGNINNTLDRVDMSFTADDGVGADDVKATWLR
jgi:hypothetical protein